MTTPAVCNIQLQGNKLGYNRHASHLFPGKISLNHNPSVLAAQQRYTQESLDPLQNYLTDNVTTILEDNKQFKLQLQAITTDKLSLISHLSKYMLLYNDSKARNSQLEAKLNDIEEMTSYDPAKRDVGNQMTTKRESKVSEDPDARQRELVEDMLGLAVNCSYKDLEYKPKHPSPKEMMKIRLNILAGLPAPEGLSSDDLIPLKIPSDITLEEFLQDKAFDCFRKTLSGHCAFTELTAMWCPDREEHGFYLTPLYKCETSSRSNIIHRWTEVEVKARMAQPTECFYKRQSEWYYVGTYKAVRLPDLTPEEYAELSQETVDSLVAATLSARKNITPQIVFETSQLYGVGALKVAVVGIQCVGYNGAMNTLALRHGRDLHKTNKVGK